MSQHVGRGHRTILVPCFPSTLFEADSFCWYSMLCMQADRFVNIQGFSCLHLASCLMSTLIREVCSGSQLYLDSGDVNLDPHACTASHFSTEPSPQPILWTSDPPFSVFLGDGIRGMNQQAWFVQWRRGNPGLAHASRHSAHWPTSPTNFLKKCSPYPVFSNLLV